MIHEHTRPDRDDYVSINESNIWEQLLYNFEKDDRRIEYYGEKYDYHSIMHYSKFGSTILENKSLAMFTLVKQLQNMQL